MDYCWREKNHLTPCCQPMALLNTPEILQKGSYDCGRTACLIVARFHGVSEADADVMAGRLPVDKLEGTDPAAISSWWRSEGWGCCEGWMDADAVQHHCENGRPVILLAQLHGGGHWTVARGISRKTIHFQDPANGRWKMPVDQFIPLWHDHNRFGAKFRQWGIVGVRV